MMMMTIIMMKAIKTIEAIYDLTEIYRCLTRKRMEQNGEQHIAMLRNVLGANDINSNKFDCVFRREDFGNINNTNDSTTPNNGLVNGEGYLERMRSILGTDSYLERIRSDLETYWIVHGIDDDHYERAVMACGWILLVMMLSFTVTTRVQVKRMNILVMGNEHVVKAYISGEENERICILIICCCCWVLMGIFIINRNHDNTY